MKDNEKLIRKHMGLLTPDWIVSNIEKYSEHLLADFLFHLYEKGLINDYDFEYEKEVKKYLKK